MGKAARRRRHTSVGQGPLASRPVRDDDPRERANAALTRLVRTNAPGRVSLAGAYAFGYAELGMAQQEGRAPEWYHDLDPLDALVLGTVWPSQFRDAYEFGNARTAWLRLMRTTPHWRGIERFVNDVLAASEQHGLPVDDGELMLLVAGRLEDVGLDQRKLPAGLLAGNALANTRVAVGPDPDIELPQPPPDAGDRVARFWASTQVALPNDGTIVDALREGLHMLAHDGVNVREDAVVLLPALYAALVARDDEQLDEAGERAEAWAWCLPQDSPLTPVVDVIFAAMRRELDVDAILGHLFAVPTFNAAAPAADRQFTADPGTALTALAFELGHRQVNTRDHKTIRLDAGAQASLDALATAFEEKFGRPPGPKDPIFFDRDADVPQSIDLAGLEAHTTAMLQAAGICGAWIYAYQHTDGLLPRPDGGFNTEADSREWFEAVDGYLRTHPGETTKFSHELAKLRMALAIASVISVAGDPSLGYSLAQRLDHDELDSEADVVADFLDASAEALTERLADRAVMRAAVELALAWSGSKLAARVRNLASTPAEDVDDNDLPALLAIAAATMAPPKP